MNTGNIKHIITLQRYIGCSTVHDAFYIYLNNLFLQILALAMQHRTSCKGITHKAFSLFHQLADCIQGSSELINARTIDSPLDFKLVLKTVQNSFSSQRITIFYLEYGIINIINRINLILLSVLTNHAERTGIGIPRKSTGILQQRGNTFVVFHLVFHGAFHITLYANQRLVWRNDDHIAFLQADIIIDFTFHNKIVHIYGSDFLSSAHYLYIAQTTDIAHATGTVQCMKHGRERRQCISSRLEHFPHHVHLDRPAVSQSNLDL